MNTEAKSHADGHGKGALAGKMIGAAFYFLLIACVLIVALVSTGDRRPYVLFGYSAFAVLSSSMQSALPKGSVIIVKQTPAAALKAGDDITFMLPDGGNATHRIVSIDKNYKNSGMAGFTTWGIENPMPDEQIVYAPNVVGRVVFHINYIGGIASLIRSHLPLFIIMAGLLIAFIHTLRIAVRPARRKENDIFANAERGI